jgi:large subunit ribosomal protein L25
MNIKLAAEPRQKDERLSSDYLPGVIYGRHVKNLSLKLKKSETQKAFQQAGESSLIDLEIEGKAHQVIIKDVRRGAIKGELVHIDFFQVDMREKVSTSIPLLFVGESRAVKELGGTLIKDLDALDVECLPGDLLENIKVDISVFDSLDSHLKVSDLFLPKGIEVLNPSEALVVSIAAPKQVSAEENTPPENPEKAEAKPEENK